VDGAGANTKNSPICVDGGTTLTRRLANFNSLVSFEIAVTVRCTSRLCVPEERSVTSGLYGDPLDRFTLVSFVRGPGQRTPVHDHLMWGLVGMLRGVEEAVPYNCQSGRAALTAGEATCLRPGMVQAVSPHLGDIHTVANALPDRPSISIHLYGGNIGTVRRHGFDLTTGAATAPWQSHPEANGRDRSDFPRSYRRDRAGFCLAAGLNAGYVIVEVAFGFATGSLALLADAAHNLTDVAGLMLAWGAAMLAQC
jgi:predicted metal-dependent enzyme (double-stranded beta helix superfamily)